MIDLLFYILSAFSVAAPINSASLDLAQMETGLTLELRTLKTESGTVFKGANDCAQPPLKNKDLIDFTGKCFEFQTKKNTRLIQIPVSIVKDRTSPKVIEELIQSLKSKGSEINQEQTKDASWGSMQTWKTTAAPAEYYIFLNPVDKKLAARIGPIPRIIIDEFELKWSLKPW